MKQVSWGPWLRFQLPASSFAEDMLSSRVEFWGGIKPCFFFRIKLKQTVFDCPHMDPILRHCTTRGVTYGKYPPPLGFSSASDNHLNSTCLLSEEHNLDQGGLLLNFVATSFVIWSSGILSRWPETLGSSSSLSTSSISSQHFNYKILRLSFSVPPTPNPLNLFPCLLSLNETAPICKSCFGK